MSFSFFAWFIAGVRKEMKTVSSTEKKRIPCPACGAKTKLLLLQRTVLRDFLLFCLKCKRESIIRAQNFRIEIIDQPDARTQW